MLKMKVIKREPTISNDPNPQRLDSQGSARGSIYGGFGMGRSFNGSVRGDSASRQLRSGSSQRSALEELLKTNQKQSRVQSPKGLPEITTPRNINQDQHHTLNEIQKVLPSPQRAELRRNLAGKSLDVAASPAINHTLAGIVSPRASAVAQSFTSPIKPRSG